MPLRTAFLILLATVGVRAADFHVTPSGAGKKDGSSWANALEPAAMQRVFNETMQPGDRLLLAGGEYKDASFSIAFGGVDGKPKAIVGVDRGAGLPVFSSTWAVTAPTKGKTAIAIAPGATHVVLQHLRIKGYVFGVLAPPVKQGAARSHLVFDDVDMEQFRHGFYLSDCDDLRLSGCDLKRYSKHAFRFDQGCDRATLQRCTADCSEGDAEWEKHTEALPFGFTVTDGGAPNTEFAFEDCLSRNNLMPLQKGRYKNGDGFVVEGNTTGVSFLRCRAIRNQDGGFDLKVRDVKLTDCLAIGNSRGFRIWTTGTLINCFAGWGKSGLWCNGGPLTVNRCTFHAQQIAVLTDDKAQEPVTLNDCLISVPAGGKAIGQTARGTTTTNATIITGTSGTAQDPEFPKPDPAWDGVGDAMNSRTYPEKGYRSGTSAGATNGAAK